MVATNISIEEKLELYTAMYRIRQFETKAAELFRAGEMPGHMHSSVGQEASAVGVLSLFRKSDYLIGSHRGHGQCLAKGAESKPLLAELLGREAGYCHGRGGSMHVADTEIGILGTNGIVGGGIPIALGVGVAIQYNGTDDVVAVYFGDGAANQGTFHETLNIAALWSLPIIFVCENNLYAELTPQSIHTKIPDIAPRAEVYGMAWSIVDGQDVLAVRDAASAAVNRARSGNGPTLIECKTYRWDGHYVGDPAKYRPAGELEEWKKRDPLVVLSAHLLSECSVENDVLNEIENKINDEIAEAAEFAIKSEFPDPSEHLLKDVYTSFIGW